MKAHAEKTPVSPDTNPNRLRRGNNRALRALFAVAIAATAAGMVGCSASAEKAPSRTPTKADTQHAIDSFGQYSSEEATIDPTIESVTIDLGANLRQSPRVPDLSHDQMDNLLTKTGKEFTVRGNKDIISGSDDNGRWYAIPENHFAELPYEVVGDMAKSLEKDDDHYIVVNSQKAHANYYESDK